jgi:glycosyltransferase involved in cell wall biosynthesis
MAEDSPLVSVVVPAHQSAATIGATVASVLWQTYPTVELVVVDDGSTDATAAVVEAPGDPRIRLVRQGQSGPGAARNHGLAEARGQLVAFVDSDDILLPDYLAACVAVWRRTGGIVTSNAYWMFPGGIDPRLTRHKGPLPQPQDQRLTLLQQNWVSIMSVFPRAMVEEVGAFDDTLERAEDWDLWLRAVFAGWVVSHQPRPLALFNRSRQSQTSNRALVFASERRVLEQMSQRSDLRPDERDYLTLRLASPSPGELAGAAEADLLAGRYREAAGQFARAAALLPSERELVMKSRLMRLGPAVTGRALRHRSSRRAARLGTAPEQD